MKPHQKRVVKELKQTKKRLSKLTKFLSRGRPEEIDNADWNLLTEQWLILRMYVRVLTHRISRF